MTVELVPAAIDAPAVDTLDLVPKAFELAQHIARTEFVPSALRGKPEAVMAAILTGHEVGIGAMQALSKIHVIDGRPAMAAELMRGLVLRAGHELWIEESTTTKCTVVGVRAGSSRETRITFTMDDAKRAGLDGRKNWRSYPAAMLLARATAALCRAVFPDVLAGISYTTEELEDGDVVQVLDGDGDRTPPAPKGKTKKAAKSITSGPGPVEPAPEPPPAADVPALPGEDEPAAAGGAGDREVPGSLGGVASPPAASADDARRTQTVAIWCKDAGLDDDGRHALLEAFSRQQYPDADEFYASAKHVPHEHVEALRRTLKRLEAGQLQLAEKDGIPVLIEVAFGWPSSDPGATSRGGAAIADEAIDVGSTVESGPPSFPVTDWSVELDQTPGIGETKLLNEARKRAHAAGMAQPDALGDIDPALHPALVIWLEEKRQAAA